MGSVDGGNKGGADIVVIGHDLVEGLCAEDVLFALDQKQGIKWMLRMDPSGKTNNIRPSLRNMRIMEKVRQMPQLLFDSEELPGIPQIGDHGLEPFLSDPFFRSCRHKAVSNGIKKVILSG